MKKENPSDLLEFEMRYFGQQRTVTVGEARDFLEKPTAILHPLTLLKIAKGMRRVLHEEADYTIEGHEVLLPEEIDRRSQLADELLARPSLGFSEEGKH